MALSARELVFYIRAENQASKVFQRVARDLRALPSQKELEARAATATSTAKAVTSNAPYLNTLKAANAEQAKSVKYRQEEIRAQLRSNELIAQYNRAQEAVLSNQAQLNAAKAAQLRAQIRLNDLEKAGAAGATPGTRAALSYEAAQASAAAAATRVQLLSQREKVLGDAIGDVTLKTEAWALAEQQALAEQNLAKYDRVATSLHSIGSAARLAGAVVIASLAGAAHAAAKFQTSNILAATQARPVGAPASKTLQISGQLNDIVLKQMKQFPAAAKDMSDSLYQIFSGTKVQGIKQAGSLLNLFNRAAVAGGTDLHSMTEAFITIFNNFPQYFHNTTAAANIFFSAVRYGRMTASQFANSLAYILPIAKEAGSTFKNVAQDMAFFTRQTGGRLTRQDAQGYARLIQLLSRDDVSSGLAGRGIAVFNKETGKMRPLISILSEIHDKLKMTPQETLNFFKTISAAGGGKGGTQGTIQAIRIFAQATQNAKAYGMVVKDVRADTNEFARSFSAMSQAPDVKWQTFVNNMRVLALVIGAQVMPALVQLAQPLIKLVYWFNGLSDSSKHLISMILVIGGASLLVGGQILMMVTSIVKMSLAFRLLRMAKGAEAIGALGAETGMVAPQLVVFMVLITGLTFAFIKWHKQIMHAIDAMGGLKVILVIVGSVIVGMAWASYVNGMAAAATEATVLKGALAGVVTVAQGLVVALAGIAAYKGTKFILDKTGGGGWLFHQGQKLADIFGAGTGVDPNAGFSRKAQELHTQAIAKFAVKQARDAVHDLPLAGDAAKKTLQNAKDTLRDIAKDPSWKALFSQAANARKLVAEAPTTANWKAYFAALKQLAQASTKDQYEAAIKVLEQIKVKGGGGIVSMTDKQVMAAVQNINKLYREATKHPSPAAWKAYYAALNALSQNATQLQMQVAQQYLNTDVAATKKAAKDKEKIAKDSVNKAQQIYTQAAQTLQSTYQSLFQGNESAFGSLFGGPFVNSPRMQTEIQFGHKLTGKDLVKDLKSQVTRFKAWRFALKRLRNAGVPWELYQQIVAAGPDSLPDVNALLSLSKSELNQYFKTFKQSRGMIEQATQQDLGIQLKHYRKFGQNIALAILQGLRDEKTPLLKYFENLVKDMFPGLVKDAHGKAKDVTKGKAHDTTVAAQTRTPPKPVKPHKPRVVRTTSSATPVQHTENNTYVVHADPKSDIATQLKHAHFTARHRARLNP